MNGRRDAVVAAIAAYGLDGDRRLDPPDEDAMTGVYLEGLSGPLWRAIEEGAVPPGEYRDRAARWQSDAMRGCLRLEQRLLEVWGALEDVGIEARVLKGSAVAHLDYPDPEWRPFRDIDLLVPADRLDEAVELLEATGGKRLFIEPRPGFAARFFKSVTVRQRDGVQIDLHRTLADGPYGLTIVTGDLFAAPEGFTLAGRRLLALGPEARFVHACVHTVLGRATPELRPLRDVAQIDRHPGLDHDLALGLARRWHLEAVVARAVVLVDETLGAGSVLLPWARAHRPDRFERRALPAYHGPGAGYRRKAVATVPAIDGLGDRLRYVTGLLFPSRSYLAARDGGRLRRLGAALRQWRSARRVDGP